MKFEIDSKLANLDLNFFKVKEKIKSIYPNGNLTICPSKGKLQQAKTKLCSQLTYVATVLDTNDTIINDIQSQINNFVNDVKVTGSIMNNFTHPLTKGQRYDMTD